MAGTGSSRDIPPKASLASLRELDGTEQRLALEAIRRGLEPSATQEEKNSALHLACTHDQTLDIKLLIKANADLSIMLDLASRSGSTSKKYTNQLTSLFNEATDPEGTAPFILDCITSDSATFSQATTGVTLSMKKNALKETLLGKASGLASTKSSNSSRSHPRTATTCWEICSDTSDSEDLDTPTASF